MGERTRKEAARGPGRPRSDAAHDAILAAAVTLIREVGYDAVAMDGIAARAGVGKATLYRRWQSKELLVCDALERLMREIPTPDTGSVRGDLLELMNDQLGLYSDPGTRGLLSGLVAAMERSERIAEVVRGGFYRARHDAMAEVLRRGVRRGELRKRIDLELALDLLNGPFFYRYLLTGGPIDPKYARAVVDAVLGAFAARG